MDFPDNAFRRSETTGTQNTAEELNGIYDFFITVLHSSGLIPTKSPHPPRRHVIEPIAALTYREGTALSH